LGHSEANPGGSKKILPFAPPLTAMKIHLIFMKNKIDRNHIRPALWINRTQKPKGHFLQKIHQFLTLRGKKAVFQGNFTPFLLIKNKQADAKKDASLLNKNSYPIISWAEGIFKNR
jgi:hypothetical protein